MVSCQLNTPIRSPANTLRLIAVVLLLTLCADVVGCRESAKPVRSPASSPPESGKYDQPAAPAQPTSRTVPEEGVSGASSATSVASFQNIAAESGVDFTYRNGEEAGVLSIVESLGGGVGIADYDRDGQLDLVFPGGGNFEDQTVSGAATGLFRQVRPDQFADVAAFAGVARAKHYSHGIAIADVGDDGFPDLLITGYGGLTLYRNRGDGTFDDVTTEAGLLDDAWSSSAAWGDLTGDGILDLYIAHYVDWSFDNHPTCESDRGVPDVCPPRQFTGLRDTLYAGQPDGTFRDVTDDAALAPEGKGLGVLLGDLDLDGDLDAYVTNDTVANRLYENRGSLPMQEVGMLGGVAMSDAGHPDGSMGVALGDLTLDGLPDLWVANYERESFALYRNLGGLAFLHSSGPLGVTAVGPEFVGWGAVVFDMDRDADEDVFVANGHVIHYPRQAPVRQSPLLFENMAGKRLRNVAASAGDYMQSPHPARGVATGDLNNDGRIDLVVAHQNEPVAVLRNDSPDEGHWLSLRLVQPSGNRDAIGAYVVLQSGDRQQLRLVTGGGSYASTNSPALHFGLGAVTNIDNITIHWPGGETQSLDPLDVDRAYIVVRNRPPQPLTN